MAYAIGRNLRLLVMSPFSPVGDYAEGIGFLFVGFAHTHKKLSFLTSDWGGSVVCSGSFTQRKLR